MQTRYSAENVVFIQAEFISQAVSDCSTKSEGRRMVKQPRVKTKKLMGKSTKEHTGIMVEIKSTSHKSKRQKGKRIRRSRQN